jgi:hypothetical protein
MFKAAFLLFGLSVATTSYSAEPILDNAQVTVWDTTTLLGPAENDFVAVSLAHEGTATFGHKGEDTGKTGERTIVIELKDHPLAPIGNTSGYPLAFPRLNATKLLENDKVVVWDNVWHPGKPTPMHFHDKDALVVYEPLVPCNPLHWTANKRSATTNLAKSDLALAITRILKCW